MQKNKKKYSPPCILSQIDIPVAESILAGSLVDSIEHIESTGQGVDTYDFNQEPFNYNWE